MESLSPLLLPLSAITTATEAKACRPIFCRHSAIISVPTHMRELMHREVNSSIQNGQEQVGIQHRQHTQKFELVLSKLYDILNLDGHLLVVDFDKNEEVVSDWIFYVFIRSLMVMAV